MASSANCNIPQEEDNFCQTLLNLITILNEEQIFTNHKLIVIQLKIAFFTPVSDQNFPLNNKFMFHSIFKYTFILVF